MLIRWAVFMAAEVFTLGLSPIPTENIPSYKKCYTLLGETYTNPNGEFGPGMWLEQNDKIVAPPVINQDMRVSDLTQCHAWKLSDKLTTTFVHVKKSHVSSCLFSWLAWTCLTCVLQESLQTNQILM